MRPEVAFTSSLSPLGRSWRRAVDLALRPFGLSEAIAAPLIYIGRSGGGMTQIELAALIGIGGPSMVRLLDRLVTTGLVERCADPHDKRVNRLHLTAQGAAFAERIEQALDQLRAEVLAGVSTEDLYACLQIFERMENGLAALEANWAPPLDSENGAE